VDDMERIEEDVNTILPYLKNDHPKLRFAACHAIEDIFYETSYASQIGLTPFL
jgi:hypothetical protein